MIRADVIYTGEYLRDSEKYNNRSHNIKAILINIALLPVDIAFIVLCARYFNAGELSLLFRAGVVFGILLLFSNTRNLINLLRSGRIIEQTPPAEEKREYFFDDKGLTFIKRGTISEIKREFTYDQLYSATETNRYFYIYLYKNMICIIGKNDFIEGSAEELRGLLIKHMCDKFLIDTEGGV